MAAEMILLGEWAAGSVGDDLGRASTFVHAALRTPAGGDAIGPQRHVKLLQPNRRWTDAELDALERALFASFRVLSPRVNEVCSVALELLIRGRLSRRSVGKVIATSWDRGDVRRALLGHRMVRAGA